MNSLAGMLTSASVGALISGVLVAIITAVSKRGTERATAIKSVAEAESAAASAGKLGADAAEVLTGIAAQMTADIRKDMQELKTAVNGLTHAVENAIPLLEQAGHAEVASDMRSARENVWRVM